MSDIFDHGEVTNNSPPLSEGPISHPAFRDHGAKPLERSSMPPRKKGQESSDQVTDEYPVLNVGNVVSPIEALKKYDPVQDTPTSKLPWEHPETPENAAERAAAEILTLGPDRETYENAAFWLNDTTYRGYLSAREFKIIAAEAFNRMQIKVARSGRNDSRVVALQSGDKNVIKEIDQ